MLEQIEMFIENYGIIAIFIIVMLEYACFPIPSEIVLPLAGALSLSLETNIILMVLILSVAGLIGLTICYLIGFFGGRPLVDKMMRKSKKINEGLTYSFLKFEKYQNISVCLGRVIPLCRTYISFIAGVFKQNIGKYLFFSFIGVVVWNSVLITLGYIFYDNIDFIISVYDKYKVVCIILIVLFILAFISKKIYDKRRKRFNFNYENETKQ